MTAHVKSRTSPSGATPPELRAAVPDSDRGFREMYSAQTSYLLNVLRRLGVPPSHVEDLAQDVFLVAYLRYSDYDPARPIRPWLFGIAVRRVSSFRERAYHLREVHQQPPEMSDERACPEQHVAAHQDRDRVLRALDCLDLAKRSVFVLHEIEGSPIPEVAHALGIPLNTAYSRLRRAREMFEAEVRRQETARSVEAIDQKVRSAPARFMTPGRALLLAG